MLSDFEARWSAARTQVDDSGAVERALRGKLGHRAAVQAHLEALEAYHLASLDLVRHSLNFIRGRALSPSGGGDQ